MIDVKGTSYYVNDGVEEFIEDILSHPEFKISFYSGGKAQRNEELLAKIKLKNGKSLLEMAYKVLSNEDLVTVEAPEGARFAERYKKDLKKISKNLDELIMFDDVPNFFLENTENQGNHVFFIGKAYEHFETYEETQGMSGEYIPRNYDEWLLNKKKMNILNGVFQEAYTESVESGIPFGEAIKKREELLNLKDQEWSVHSTNYYKKIQSAEKLKKRSPRLDCRDLMNSLIRI